MSLYETSPRQQEKEWRFPVAEIFPGLRTESRVMVLDFVRIPDDLPPSQRIDTFFQMTEAAGINPRLPEERQRFNNALLSQTGGKYLIGQYLENRIAMLAGSSIAEEGRTYHLGIDVFTSGLDSLHTPAAGKVARIGREPGKHSYGYYAIVEHLFGNQRLYAFYGHLSSKLPEVGTVVGAGQPFAQLGDFVGDENGGWSRHVHVQLLRELPEDTEPPIGYSSLENLSMNSERFPDPNLLLQIPGL